MRPRTGLLVVCATLALFASPPALASEGEMPGNVTATRSAFRTIDAKLVKIDGEYYVVEDPNGKEYRLHVGKETVFVNGPKEVGDKMRVEVTEDGHALSIQ